MKRTDLLHPTRPRGPSGPSRDSSPVATFDKILRAFDTGGFTYTDFLEQLNQLLATGAPAAELLEVLRRRELIEPLPRYAYNEVLELLNHAVKRTEAAGPADPQQTRQDLDSDHLAGLDSPSEANDGALEERLRSAEDQIALQQADYEVLAQSYERAQAAESASIERESTLAAELTAARAALESEQSKNAELIESWAESNTSIDALTQRVDETARESNHYRDELRSLEDALAARDAKLSELQQSEAELQTARARSSALTADLAAAQNALESEQQKIREVSDEAARNLNRYQAELRELQETLAGRDVAIFEAQQSVAERDADLASARTSLESAQSKTRELQQALAESVASTDVAITRGEDALNELNHHQAEVQKLRDALAASDATIAGVRRSLSEREAELGALRLLVEGGAQLQTDLRAARARAETTAAELKAIQTAAAPLQAQRDRLQGQVSSLQAKLKVYEELLEQSQRAAEQRESEHSEDYAPLPPQQASPAAQRANVAPAPVKLSGRPAAPRLRPSKIGRPLAIGAVVLVGVAWYVAHRKETPPPVAPSVGIAAPAAGTVIRDCPTCPAMTVLPAGRFTQGSDRADAPPFEKPLHWVIIGQPLAMSTNPVTVGEFQQFIAATNWDMQGCDTYDGEWKRHPDNSWKSPGFEQTAAHPVTCASWEDAQAFAEWLSTKTGHKYRLPSASEWEYGARAGTDAVQPWTDGSDACANANVADASAAQRYPGWTVFACDDGYVNTAPVGIFKANAFGLHDMLGNVFQWTEDCWHPDYVDAPIDGSARDDGGCTERELRGGSWFSTPAYVRANYRNHFASDYRTSSVGIRLVRGIEQ